MGERERERERGRERVSVYVHVCEQEREREMKQDEAWASRVSNNLLEFFLKENEKSRNLNLSQNSRFAKTFQLCELH